MDAVLPLSMPDGWDAGLALPPVRSKGAERQSRQRDRWKANGESQHKHRKNVSGLPFVGVDGEGAGVDDKGRQNYLLLRAGSREMFAANRPLGTRACLDFLCSLPRGSLYIGFSFGYDVTMILRDLSKERLDHLFKSEAQKMAEGISYRYTFWQDFAIEYLPRQYFRVARVKGDAVVPNSSRTIYEVFGFFQCSFLKALDKFGIGTEQQRIEIEENKARRGDFTEMTAIERHYNELECDLLAQLMEEFRDVCYAADIRPRTWNGAGKLASALHGQHKTPRRLDLVVPAGFMQFAATAYYGGRFEITRTGAIEGPIHEYDIRSAYPAAMQTLPCLVHGRWTRSDQLAGNGGLSVASCAFKHRQGVPLCGLPVRNRQGRLFWPRQGCGTYWSVETDAARELGAEIEYGEGWTYETDCDCRPFDWVSGLYDYRRSIGAAVRGYPIKLGINSLYGQLARRVGGGGPWTNHLWAGLITAQTRAALAVAAAAAPSDILMLATDGIYSRTKLPVDVGDGLGQWEHKVWPSMFTVQPGLYWGPDKPKTRGVPRGFFEGPAQRSFEAAWSAWMDAERAVLGPSRAARMAVRGMGYVRLPLTNFIGLKLAHARGKPDTAGVWKADKRDISFDWSIKRELATAQVEGGAMRHWPHAGSPDLVSQSYAWTEETVSMAQELAALTEGLPDFLDFSAPGFGE